MIWATKIFILLNFSLIIISDKNEIKKEIINLNKAYINTTTYGMQVITSGYNLTTNKPLKVAKVTLYAKPGYYYTANESSESMANSNFKINIHHGKKIIIVTKVQSNALPSKALNTDVLDSKAFDFKLDTVIDYYKSVELESLNANQNLLVFAVKGDKEQKSKVTYNKKSYQVNQIEYFISGKSDLKYTITYTYFKSESVTNKLFSEQKYFNVKNNKIILNPSYSNYKLSVQ